jgi:hypothetical protein
LGVVVRDASGSFTLSMVSAMLSASFMAMEGGLGLARLSLYVDGSVAMVANSDCIAGLGSDESQMGE